MRAGLFFGVFLISIPFSVFAGKVDSLLNLLPSKGEDSSKVILLNKIANLESSNNTARSIDLAKQAIALSQKIAYPKGANKAYYILGTAFWYKGDLDSAARYYKLGQKVAESLGDKIQVSAYYGGLGLVASYRGMYKEAMSYYFQSVKIDEAAGKKSALAADYNNIGLAYLNQNLNKEALDYFMKALEMNKAENDEYGLSFNYMNIGIVHYNNKNYRLAIDFFNESLRLNEKKGSKEGIAQCYGNLGNCYLQLGDYDRALDYNQKAFPIRVEIGDETSQAVSYSDMGKIYTYKKMYKEAEEMFRKGLELARKNKAREWVRDIYQGISEMYWDKKDPANAYKYQKLYSDLKDSMFTSENTRQIAEMQTVYETEKKQAEIDLLNKDKVLDEANIRNQKAQKWILLAGLAGILVVALLILVGYQNKKKANKDLALKNEAIAREKALVLEQNKVIAEKNQEIQDSIAYSKTIQRAMLPNPDDILDCFDCFGLYKPKDVVSGDFYWFAKFNGISLIAAADCTGHGVPGALMSMIGSDKLNHAVLEKQLTDPSAILSSLNRGVKIALKQDEQNSSSRDGMDIALCAFDLQKMKLSYAGAHRPLYLVRDKKLYEYPPTKAAIGGLTKMDQVFEKQEISLEKGDMIYICSDGYADQFGGRKGKKFMTKNLKELLVSICDKPVDDQEKILERTLTDWKQDREQVDDILVIGIRI